MTGITLISIGDSHSRRLITSLLKIICNQEANNWDWGNGEIPYIVSYPDNTGNHRDS